MSSQVKLIAGGVIAIIGIILFIVVNPFSYNDGGSRTVVQQAGGKQFVQFSSGVFYAGFFAKETEWPNQISVTYQESKSNFDLIDNSIEVGTMEVMFSDKITAKMKGITQFVLPADEKEMILINNTHRTPESLVQKRLAPYAKECIQSAAQLMTADMHSSGGRAQMSQDYNQQLREGVLLLSTKEKVVYDSIDKEQKRVYENIIQTDKNGQPQRKSSSVKEYGITIADAQITDVQYDDKFLNRRSKLIEAATNTAVSKSDLLVAQQKTLTGKAQGEQKLVEIEYAQKQEQMKSVVAAETKVKLAEQDKLEQKIAYEASIMQANKIRELANAEAYAKTKIMLADGALDKKLEAYVTVQKNWADAFKEYGGNIVPTYQLGGSYAPGSSSNGMQNFMDIQNMKALRDLNLQMTNK